MNQELAFQLAFCYKAGFGGFRDEQTSMRMLHKSGRTQQELNATINQLRSPKLDRVVVAGTVYSGLLATGHISYINFTDQYRSSNKMEEADAEIRREIEDIEYCIGKDSHVWMISTGTLSRLCQARGLWEKAEKLEMQVMETSSRILGPGHLSTMTAISNLASTYYMQGRWKEAKGLQKKELKICGQRLGTEHPHTLNSKANLASIYRQRGRWEKAEHLERQIIETRERIQGLEHPSTLTGKLPHQPLTFPIDVRF